MVLRLVKTDLHPDVQHRIIRMTLDARQMGAMTAPEIRAVYFELEAMRNLLSDVIKKVDDDGL